MIKNKLRVGITHGDYNGISYEIIIKALADSRMLDLCTPVVYGSAKVAQQIKPMIAEAQDFNFNVVASVDQAVEGKANLVVCGDENGVKIELGRGTAVSGSYAIASLNAAVRDVKAGKIDVLVTCPINKKNTAGEGFGFIGHTEYLASEFSDVEPLMFMVSDVMKIGLVTMHVPLSEVSSLITTENVLQHIRMIKRAMERDFGVRSPRIAVLGLNPHAGDEGLLGMEEQNVIIPAIKSAEYENIVAVGPFAADGFFGSGAYRKFDAVLAMYHDQGLAPFKALTFADGVNFTAGLSVVRTSPAHGVGYDIAGRNLADHAPLRAAIYAAIDIHRSREVFNEITANPLQSSRENGRGERGDRGGDGRHDANVEELIREV